MATQADIGQARRSDFYFWMAVIMLLATLAGFGSALLTGNFNDVVSPLPTYIALHGVVLTGWFSWLVLQSWLVRAGNTALHRKTGIAGIGIGLLVIVSTPPVFLNSPQRLMSRGLEWSSDMREFAALGVEGRTVEQFSPMVVFGSMANIASFTLLLAAAIWWRSTAAVHKRLMLLASIAIFAPALARVSRWPGLGGEDGAFLPAAILTVLLVPLVHDRLSSRRFHKATLAGTGLIIAMQIAALAFAQSDAGRAFVHGLV